MLVWKDVPERDGTGSGGDPLSRLGRAAVRSSRAVRGAATEIRWAMRDAAGTARGAARVPIDARSRLTRDYDSRDLWELGSSVCKRMCGLLGTLAAAMREADNPMASRMEEAREVIWAWEGYDNDMLVSWDSRGHASESVPDGVRSALEHRFEEEWRWVGLVVMGAGTAHACSAVLPTGADAPPMGIRARMAADRLRRRLPSAGIPVDRLPAYELHRLSAMLDDFARDEVGHPVGYAASEHVLVDREEGWEAQPLPIGVALSGNSAVREAAAEVARTADRGGVVVDHTVRCSDIGADYAAYLDDLTVAADGIGAWADWLDGIAGVASGDGGDTCSLPVAVRLAAETEDGAEAARAMEQGMVDRFMRAWEWLGHNLHGLWI